MTDITLKKGTSISADGIPNTAAEDPIKWDPVLGQVSRLRVGSLLRVWAEVSKINYLSSKPLDIIALSQSIRRRSIGLPTKEYSVECFVPTPLRNKSVEDLFAEVFPVNVTTLLNEDQLWGCFYTFPELYADVYSPVVNIRDIDDVPKLKEGVLTRDMVTACLTYLKRTPILGDFVYIKLDLSGKHLINIDVLEHYKYLVYLDLSSNLLTELKVLSRLLYLQYLSVAFNKLNSVLDYDTPQWFLTEVHYKYNSVKRIPDLSLFWSITILDLSYNNIKAISGLENLRYLRRLDLSFNHIQRLENLNNLRLLWLDVSYNNISSFEFDADSGLWTLLHLEYLNLNENNITSLKIFSGCVRLRELHARNNRLSMLLELAVYMRQMRRLIIVDLRANPICSTPGYKDVVFNTFPLLLSLDAQELDPVEQRTAKMEMAPDIKTFATRRLLRLLYVEQLSRAKVSQNIPPADTTEVPLIVIVGHEALGKGTLVRRLSKECSSHVEQALLHTTAPYHIAGHYKEISRDKFDDMLLTGEFLTYSELDGESYGLSREQSFIKDSKVRVACMDLTSALMLELRGRRPYLILATCQDTVGLIKRQQMRKIYRNEANKKRICQKAPLEQSTLQVLVSGRIIITGILNEIILSLPEEKEHSEFDIEYECSIMMDSEARHAVENYARGVNLLNILTSSATSEENCKPKDQVDPDSSLYSLYKGSQGTGEYTSYIGGQNSSYQGQMSKKSLDTGPHKGKPSNLSRPKSVDFSRYASSTWKGLSMNPDGSKSVTFTSTEANKELDPNGMLIEPCTQPDKEFDASQQRMRSISARVPWATRAHSRLHSAARDDPDLWLAFLTETGLMQASNDAVRDSVSPSAFDIKSDDPNVLIHEMSFYHQLRSETFTTNIRDDYEGIHQKCPGLFWDSVQMDNPDEAFNKVKGIIRNIVKSQSTFKPMFDIDFTNLNHYPTVENRLERIRQQIAPQQLFY